MKKVITILSILLIIFITGCTKKNSFEDEYNIKLEKDLFVYKTVNDIYQAMDNKETFVLFTGDSSEELAKPIIETLINASNTCGLEKIYYVNNKDEKYDELIGKFNETSKVLALNMIKGQLQDVTKENNPESIESIVCTTQEKLSSCDDDC